MVIPTHIAEKGAAPSFREREETRRFYTETLLHTESFTHKHFYTQTLSHRDVFHAHTHRRISTQRLLHENTLTHRRFYTQTLLHTYAFTCRCLFTGAHTLSHTNAFTHRRFCTQTQTLFHTDPFTYRRFYTQTLLHSDTFTHRRFSTQTLLHTDAFTHFYTETLTKRGTTGWPQLQTKVRKHSCNGNAKKSQKCTRPGSVQWSTHNPMQGIRSLRYKISSAPWCRGWPQLQTQWKCYKMQKYTNTGSVTWHPRESRSPCKNALNDSTIASSISWWQGWHLFHCISPMSLQGWHLFHCSCISMKPSHIFFSCYTSHRSTAS